MKKIINSLKQYKGFTLVELMVVVAIIGILSAVAIPNFKKYKEKAKMTEAKIGLASMYTGLISHEMDEDTYVGATLTSIGYLSRNKRFTVGFGTSSGTTCAAATAGEFSCSALTGSGLNEDSFTIEAVGEVSDTRCDIIVDEEKDFSKLGGAAECKL